MRNHTSVKIQRKTHKKQYLRGKSTYKYERLYLPIPKRFNELLESFLDQRLKIEVKNDAEGFIIILSKKPNAGHNNTRKNVSVPRKHLAKTQD